MKTKLWYGPSLVVLASLAVLAAGAETPPNPQPSVPISMDQLGAVAGKQYQGDGLSIAATPDGARLRCDFQRLRGEGTREGLWLSSTADNASGERFRVIAVEVGRVTPCAPLDAFGFGDICWINKSAELRFGSFLSPIPDAPIKRSALPPTGIVDVANNFARFIRPGLTEEYCVSVDGVRQDFIIEQQPGGEGELRVDLDVTGAKAEPMVNGAQLVLNGSGRKIAYNRLRVADATGRELPARMEVIHVGDEVTSLKLCSSTGNHVEEMSLLTSSPTNRRPKLAVVVNDTGATYPIRIDPTFSDANWVSMNPGTPGADNPIRAFAVDGSGNLYIGGDFQFVGDVPAVRVAKWNGTRWSALGGGIDRGTSSNPNLPSVFSLATAGNILYAAGDFMSANNSNGIVVVNRVAKWDGANWSALGSGLNNSAYSVAASGNDVYVGGAFLNATNTGGATVSAQRIAKWDGSSWSALQGGLSGSPNTLLAAGGHLYVGGGFTFATNFGGAAVMVNRIAKWDGANWSAFGQGMNAGVSALLVSGSDLYAGGSFTIATNSGGATVSVNRIARWDGNNWSALGLGLDNLVLTLVMSGNNLYAGGTFNTATNAGGAAIPASRVAKWDGSGWSALGAGVEGDQAVYALALIGGNLYMGGFFQMVDGVAANRIARWNGASWSTLGTGMNESVSALATAGTNLYVGGEFVDVLNGGSLLRVNYIARWNGSTWSALGSGMNGSIGSMAVSGTNLYVAGNFTTAGGVAANGVAKWNGNNWSALGLGMNSRPSDLAVAGNLLYASGGFRWATNTGGASVTVNRVAKWDGTNWSALGGGLDANVFAVAAIGSEVYVGGVFRRATNSGGAFVTVNFVARWNGSSWSSLGVGMNNSVFTFGGSSTNLYASGAFTVATNTGGGTVSVESIARWNGTSWSSVGLGLDSRALSFLMLNGDLYAGGWFEWATNSGGAAVRVGSIAKWDGTNWAAVGSGVDFNVNELANFGNDLYVGGNFSMAGGKVSPYLAKVYLGTLSGRFASATYSPGSGFSSTFTDASIGQAYRIQTRSSLTGGSWSDLTNFTYNGPTLVTAPPAGLSTNRFFRAVTP